jgi:putative FmdB family regulatory protein
VPTYDYRCGACNHTWELFQSMTAQPVKACPSCGKKRAERLIGMGAAVVFKGGGFYQTDYRSEGYKKAEQAEKAAAEGKSENKAESKIESKADGPATATKSEGASATPAKGGDAPTAKDVKRAPAAKVASGTTKPAKPARKRA